MALIQASPTAQADAGFFGNHNSDGLNNYAGWKIVCLPYILYLLSITRVFLWRVKLLLICAKSEKAERGRGITLGLKVHEALLAAFASADVSGFPLLFFEGLHTTSRIRMHISAVASASRPKVILLWRV